MLERDWTKDWELIREREYTQRKYDEIRLALAYWIEEAQKREVEKNLAYNERNKCVSLIARMALALGLKAGIGIDKEAEEGWQNVVYVELPSGQVSWHIHDGELPYFSFLMPYDKNYKWDGHDTEEKYRRVLNPGDLRQRVEITEWICDTCKTVFPSFPEENRPSNLICPNCGRGCIHHKTNYENRQLRKQIEELKKTLEKMTKELQKQL